MKVIVAGSRSVRDLAPVEEAIQQSGFQITELVSGGARGVDRLAEQWARGRGIPVRTFRPDWVRAGRGAGFASNREMADYADALVAVWDGQSRGTAHMVEAMRKRGKPVHACLASGSE